MKAQLEAENQARQELEAIEQETRFRAILAEPTGAAYQQLLAEVDSFARDQGGKTLEKSLRAVFLRQAAG